MTEQSENQRRAEDEAFAQQHQSAEYRERLWAWLTAIAFCLFVGLAVVWLSKWLGTW